MRYDGFRERGVRAGSGVVGRMPAVRAAAQAIGNALVEEGRQRHALALKALVMNLRLPDSLEWRANQAAAA